MLSFQNRLELFLLSTMPSLLTLLFLIIYLVPKHIEGLSSVMPLLPLMPVFYWGLIIPRAVPYWFIFIIGLVMDAVMGTPLGLSSLLYMLFQALLHTQHKYIHKEGFIIKWAYLAALLLIVIALNWLMLSWLRTQAMPWTPALIQWLTTVACYPVVYKLFDLLDQHNHDRRWQILHGN